MSEEENFEMFPETKRSKNHGGVRSGAGRKTKYESTSTMRVPNAYKEVIKKLIKHLDSTAHLDKNYNSEKSEAIYIRSINDKKQDVIFNVVPHDK